MKLSATSYVSKRRWITLLLVAYLTSSLSYLMFSTGSEAFDKKRAQTASACIALFNKTAKADVNNFGAKLISTAITRERLVIISYSFHNVNLSSMTLTTYCGISGDAVVMNPNIETLNMLLGK